MTANKPAKFDATTPAVASKGYKVMTSQTEWDGLAKDVFSYKIF